MLGDLVVNRYEVIQGHSCKKGLTFPLFIAVLGWPRRAHRVLDSYAALKSLNGRLSDLYGEISQLGIIECFARQCGSAIHAALYKRGELGLMNARVLGIYLFSQMNKKMIEANNREWSDEASEGGVFESEILNSEKLVNNKFFDDAEVKPDPEQSFISIMRDVGAKDVRLEQSCSSLTSLVEGRTTFSDFSLEERCAIEVLSICLMLLSSPLIDRGSGREYAANWIEFASSAASESRDFWKMLRHGAGSL